MTVEYRSIPTSEDPEEDLRILYTGVDLHERVVQAFEVALMLSEGEYLHQTFGCLIMALRRPYPEREPPEGVQRSTAQVLRQVADCVDPDCEETWEEMYGVDWSELVERLEGAASGE